MLKIVSFLLKNTCTSREAHVFWCGFCFNHKNRAIPTSFSLALSDTIGSTLDCASKLLWSAIPGITPAVYQSKLFCIAIISQLTVATTCSTGQICTAKIHFPQNFLFNWEFQLCESQLSSFYYTFNTVTCTIFKRLILTKQNGHPFTIIIVKAHCHFFNISVKVRQLQFLSKFSKVIEA